MILNISIFNFNMTLLRLPSSHAIHRAVSFIIFEMKTAVKDIKQIIVAHPIFLIIIFIGRFVLQFSILFQCRICYNMHEFTLLLSVSHIDSLETFFKILAEKERNNKKKLKIISVESQKQTYGFIAKCKDSCTSREFGGPYTFLSSISIVAAHLHI